MREIKFRVWDIREKLMGSLITFNQLEQTACAATNLAKWNEGDADIEGFTDHSLVLMQYTGLKDKNGNEIYESDVLSYEYKEDSCWGPKGKYKGHISFDKGVFEIHHHRDTVRTYPNGTWEELSKADDIKSFSSWAEEIEVIGNIFESRTKCDIRRNEL